LIIWGGTSDVSKNNSANGLKYITQFVKNNNHTNIILITVPHCYDLPVFSCVNKEVQIFSSKLMKYMKLDNHISILEVDSNREYFTSHGLHLNGLGKEAIYNHIVLTMEKILHFKVDEPISMDWKSPSGQY
jgi:lysophospholipase L1-like esterase